jgi:ATP-binding cassette subfamily B protein
MLFGKHVNKYYLKYFWYFFFGIIALIAVDYAQLLVPEAIGNMVDNFNMINGISNWEYFLKPILMILGVALIMFVGRLVWRRCIFTESLKVSADIRREMFQKAEVLSQRYYKENKTGAILSYFSNDLETIEEVFSQGVIFLIDGVFLGGISLVKMFLINWKLTLISAIPLVVLLVSALLLEKVMDKKYTARQKAFEDMSDFGQENFTGIRVIKAFLKERKELREFAKVNKKNKDANIAFVKFDAFLNVLIDLLIYAVIVLIFCIGGYLIFEYTNGHNINFTAGDIIKFIGYFDAIIWPVFAIAAIINMTARGKASLRRISTLLDEEVEVHDSNEVINIEQGKLKGEIEFRNLTFAYPDDKDHPILSNISFHVNAGETVGIIGKIGSGKSSLVNMLFRLYNVEENTLLLDGYDIMKLPITTVRENIGYAPQDNFLFSDTVGSNIAFANAQLSENDISKAAQFSAVRDNIEGFDQKYKTMIGERGVTLSGGQKQRISISRAVVKDPAILVLDDSVSAVDIKTEEEILNNIKKLRAGKTTLLIASRVSTVEKLDKVLVLNEGKVEYFGTNEECMLHSPTYKRMVELQTLEKEMEG